MIKPFTWFTSSWMFLLLRIVLQCSETSAALVLSIATEWRMLACPTAGNGGFWFAEPCTLTVCCWLAKGCETVDDGSCCPKFSWDWFGAGKCCCCCEEGNNCCGCEVDCTGWGDGWETRDLCCNVWEFTCGLKDWDGKGGRTCGADNHGWCGDCWLCDVLGVNVLGGATEEVLIMLCPRKFWRYRTELEYSTITKSSTESAKSLII